VRNVPGFSPSMAHDKKADISKAGALASVEVSWDAQRFDQCHYITWQTSFCQDRNDAREAFKKQFQTK
jgi:hypothetical protein